MMEIQAARLPWAVRQINAAATRSLSARGSINFPKFVTRLYFLAIFPSRRSVRLAIIKITTDASTFQMIMIVMLILNFDNQAYQICAVVITYVALILTLVSLIDYIMKNKDVLKEQK